jgi:hypothetical protein
MSNFINSPLIGLLGAVDVMTYSLKRGRGGYVLNGNL